MMKVSIDDIYITATDESGEWKYSIQHGAEYHGVEFNHAQAKMIEQSLSVFIHRVESGIIDAELMKGVRYIPDYMQEVAREQQRERGQ